MARYVDAIVVNTRERSPGQMMGMGDAASAASSIANLITGGDYSDLAASVEQLPLLLKISIGASLVSGALAIVALVSQARGRR